MSCVDRFRARLNGSLGGFPQLAAAEGGMRPAASASSRLDRYRCALELIAGNCQVLFTMRCSDDVRLARNEWCPACVASDALSDNQVEQK